MLSDRFYHASLRRMAATMSGDLWGLVAVVVCFVFGVKDLMCLSDVFLIFLVTIQINMGRKGWFLI